MHEKQVEYKGEIFEITTQAYGYGAQRLLVNAVVGNICPSDSELQNFEAWKSYAKEAIEDFIITRKAEQKFSKWDGKL